DRVRHLRTSKGRDGRRADPREGLRGRRPAGLSRARGDDRARPRRRPRRRARPRAPQTRLRRRRHRELPTMNNASDDLTQLLTAWAGGDDAARETAMRVLYADLHHMAKKRMRAERDLITMQATGLVHEVYLRMAAQNRTQWQSRAHFFAIAARIMRR